MRILLLVAAALGVHAQTMESRMLEIPAGVDGATAVPLTVIRGARPGPALALVAGNHGYEYPPILALQRLRATIDARELSGTLYLTHAANPPAFFGRSLFVNPVDRKNLNRVYPGKADGTQSDRIAWAITREVIERADYLLDLHAGDGNENLRPYVYQTVTGDQALDARIAAFAGSLLFDHIVIDRNRPADPVRAMYCSNTAITRGKPAVTVESGYLGTTDADSVNRLLAAIENAMRHLKMLSGAARRVENPLYLDPAEVIPSPATGIFYPHYGRGEFASKGAVLAHIDDFFGKTIAEIRAPYAGVVLYIIGTPPVTQGDPAVFLGAPKNLSALPIP
jgi:predicted deacylase